MKGLTNEGSICGTGNLCLDCGIADKANGEMSKGYPYGAEVRTV